MGYNLFISHKACSLVLDVSLLSEAVHDWTFALEQRNSVHSLFLDLAKAFDSVPHYHLLLRLHGPAWN